MPTRAGRRAVSSPGRRQEGGVHFSLRLARPGPPPTRSRNQAWEGGRPAPPSKPGARATPARGFSGLRGPACRPPPMAPRDTPAAAPSTAVHSPVSHNHTLDGLHLGRSVGRGGGGRSLRREAAGSGSAGRAGECEAAGGGAPSAGTAVHAAWPSADWKAKHSGSHHPKLRKTAEKQEMAAPLTSGLPSPSEPSTQLPGSGRGRSRPRRSWVPRALGKARKHSAPAGERASKGRGAGRPPFWHANASRVGPSLGSSLNPRVTGSSLW